jgi:hypothetical protein
MEEYYPQRYLTKGLLEESLSQIKFGVTYEIEEDLPDGIEVIFSGSSVYVSEYAEGDIAIYFLGSQIGTDKDLTLADAFSIVAPGMVLSEEYPIKEHRPFASKDKVVNQIKNYFYIINTYLHSYLCGDLTWIEEFKKKARENND